MKTRFALCQDKGKVGLMQIRVRGDAHLNEFSIFIKPGEGNGAFFAKNSRIFLSTGRRQKKKFACQLRYLANFAILDEILATRKPLLKLSRLGKAFSVPFLNSSCSAALIPHLALAAYAAYTAKSSSPQRAADDSNSSQNYHI